MTSSDSLRKLPFLSAVFLITFSILIFQIAQTRILSVIIWYHLAFFAISVAMLGIPAARTIPAVIAGRHAVQFLSRHRVGDAGVSYGAVLPGDPGFTFTHHGSFVEPAAVCHGRAVCIFRRRRQSGADA